MKKYIKATTTSGLIGIWWIIDDTLVADAISVDEGYSSGGYINYSETRNHSTEWEQLLIKSFPSRWRDIASRGYKSVDRGRVVYNLLTQSYEITCGTEVATNKQKCNLIINGFNLQGCRVDIVCIPTHYHIAEITGNPALDELEYGI